MKRYFKWDDIEGTSYVETEDGCSIKQIEVTSNKYIASNRKDEKHHFSLTDTEVDDFADEITEIEFYNIWNKYLVGLIDTWTETKEKYPIGVDIEGILEVFYPKGSIIEISKDVVGIADYDECKASTTPEKFHIQRTVEGKVVGYDDTNRWLIISSPRVF